MSHRPTDFSRDGVTDRPFHEPPVAAPPAPPTAPPQQRAPVHATPLSEADEAALDLGAPHEAAAAAPPASTGKAGFPKVEPQREIACYLVEDNHLSIFDLLRRFVDGDYQAGGLSRLADLHLKVGVPARYRHDGQLVPLKGASPLTPEVVEGLLYPLLRPNQIEMLEREIPEDVDAGFHFEAEGMDFRINVFHDRDGLAGVIRALPRQVPDTKALGFPDHSVVEDILNLRQGLVVVTGVTGSGKSTTIASIIRQLNARARHRIITLEDPIEYVQKPDKCLISQREVGRNVGSFAKGLRSALREDPDVIFLGEIRDTETANLALTAAETGHLVFTTLHTRDAKGVVTRIVDLFPPERGREVMSQLSFSLAYVIAQKLLPRRDRKGRAAAFEILKNTSSVKNLIRSGNWHQIYATMQLSAKDRMVTMERHLAWLVRKGIITAETALQFANDPSQLEQGRGPGVAVPSVQPPQPSGQGPATPQAPQGGVPAASSRPVVPRRPQPGT